MSSNRHPVKKWSITFPQCGEVERKEFADSFPPFVCCVCARETHEDGGFHLHLGLELKKGLSKSKLLTWIKSKWPQDYKRIDVQATRSARDWEEYLSKEDPEPFRVEKVKVKRETAEEAMNAVMQDLMQGFLWEKEAKRDAREVRRIQEDYANEMKEALSML